MVIYIKDIQIIMGRSKSGARRLYLQILKKFQKNRDQFITYQEFSVFTGIDEDVVLEHLRQ
jgi:hypothetical protein